MATDVLQRVEEPVSRAERAPTKIWINVAGKEPPEWVAERVLTEPQNGSFDLDASDTIVRVDPGFAIFEYDDGVYACLPRTIQEKLAQVAGASNPVVAELVERTEAVREQKAATKAVMKEAPAAKARGDVPLKIKPVIGAPPAPQFAGLDQLEIDDTYQRSIEGGASQKMIVKIAENWDWRLCLPLLVSRRDGQLWVIDGQHRMEAAKLRGDIAHLPVVVFDFDDPRAEAELFVQANRSRRTMSKLDDFHAAIAAGDPKAVEVNKVVTEAGLVIGRNQAWQMIKPGEIIFVQAISRAIRNHGEPIVNRALSMMAEAFAGQVLTTGTPVFESLCTMIAESERDGKPLDLAMMTIVLSETGMAGWKEAVVAASNGYERSDLMLAAMRAAYAEAEGE